MLSGAHPFRRRRAVPQLAELGDVRGSAADPQALRHHGPGDRQRARSPRLIAAPAQVPLPRRERPQRLPALLLQRLHRGVPQEGASRVLQLHFASHAQCKLVSLHSTTF